MFHPLLDSVFTAFDQTGVRWCLLRIPSVPNAPTGDIDLLVAPADSGRVRHVLETLGFVVVPNISYRSHTFFLTYHLPTRTWIQLDVVTALSFGPYYTLRTGAEAGCLARRRRDGTAIVLADGDLFWVLLLHCLLDKGAIAPRHRVCLQRLAEDGPTDSPLAHIVDMVCPLQWSATRMVSCARGGDWALLERCAPSLAVSWARRPSSIPAVVNRIVRLLETPLHRRGLSIALLGPDGTGKSTLAAGIQGSFYFPVHLVYMGLGDDRLEPLARLRLPGIGAPGRLLTLWWRYIRARYYQLRGHIIIFDRYTYDALLPSAEPLTPFQKAARWLLAHACPRPDMVFALDAPGDIMYARKGEYNPIHLETERQHFVALRQRISTIQIVDVTRDKDVVRADLADRISQRYFARYKSLEAHPVMCSHCQQPASESLPCRLS